MLSVSVSINLTVFLLGLLLSFTNLLRFSLSHIFCFLNVK